MKQIIAMHGWSSDSYSWQPWMELFTSKGWNWKNGERGYGNLSPSMPLWQKEDKTSSKQRRVFIGHSLGPHLIPKTILSNATDVVLLNSFGRFLPLGSKNRSLKTALLGMQQRIGTTKEKEMLFAFLEKASFPQPIHTLDSDPIHTGLSICGRKRLQADLDLLIKTSGMPTGISMAAKVLVIEGEKDAIIPPESRRLLKVELEKYLQKPFSYIKVAELGHCLLLPELITQVYNWLEG